MSGVNGHSADVESGKGSPAAAGEEESKPLIEKLHDAGLIKPADGDSEEVTKSVLKKRGAKTVDAALDTSPGEKKQLLFRTSSGDGKSVAVHYQSGGDNQNSDNGASNVSMCLCFVCRCLC